MSNKRCKQLRGPTVGIFSKAIRNNETRNSAAYNDVVVAGQERSVKISWIKVKRASKCTKGEKQNESGLGVHFEQCYVCLCLLHGILKPKRMRPSVHEAITFIQIEKLKDLSRGIVHGKSDSSHCFANKNGMPTHS